MVTEDTNLKISIITISLNSEKYLEQTIQSVIEQTYQNIEYIVIDGASTDSTLNIIKKYANNLDYWISEPDNGISDAMNKGIKVANGDYILFLQSDDYLVDSTVLERAAKYLENNLDIYLFNVLLDDNGSKVLSKNKNLSWWTNFKMGSCHQGQLISRELFKRIGEFDQDFKIDMDYDFILRAYRAGASSRSVDMPLSVMRQGGISSRKNWNGLKERFLEERQVHLKNCPNCFMKLLYHVYWSAYIPYRYLLYCTNLS